MNPGYARVLFVLGLLVVAAIIAVTRKAWAPSAGHALPSIWRIAKITVAEARRRRVLQAVVVLVVLILFSMTFFSYLSPQEQARMLISGVGVISDKQRVGWGQRIIDHIWPF